jgi:hypothetical protein
VPEGETAPGRVEQPEIVTVADGGYGSQEGARAVVGGRDGVHGGDAR